MPSTDEIALMPLWAFSRYSDFPHRICGLMLGGIYQLLAKQPNLQEIWWNFQFQEELINDRDCLLLEALDRMMDKEASVWSEF